MSWEHPGTLTIAWVASKKIFCLLWEFSPVDNSLQPAPFAPINRCRVSLPLISPYSGWKVQKTQAFFNPQRMAQSSHFEFPFSCFGYSGKSFPSIAAPSSAELQPVIFLFFSIAGSWPSTAQCALSSAYLSPSLFHLERCFWIGNWFRTSEHFEGVKYHW